MDGMIEINNCGTCIKKKKEELCKVLLKRSTEIWYRSWPRRLNEEDEEIGILLAFLNEASRIQIYKTGVVRIFLNYAHFEEKRCVFLKKLHVEMLEILGE